MSRRSAAQATALAAAVAVAAACSGGATTDVVSLGDVRPGDTVGLIAVEDADDRFADIIDRVDGTIRRIDIDELDAGFTTLATIDVSTEGEQRGLLGQVIVDGTRYASWTQPDTNELVVGEVIDGGAGAIVWSAGRAGGGAIGGVLAEFDGQILLGLGRNTAFDADTDDGGAILAIDPADAVDGPDPAPSIFSVGYTNPWAFTVRGDGAIWVADNAAGPDPADESRDDLERIGRADLVADRNRMDHVPWDSRAPSAMIELPDGRIGICGFLDNELRAYDIPTDDEPSSSAVERAGTIMPCLTGAAIFADGTIATVATTDDGMALLVNRP